MKTTIRILLAAGIIVGLTAMDAAAQVTANATLTVNASVSSRAKITLGAASITFADADPDVSPTITATGLSVDVKARKASGNVTLAVAADGPLTSAASDTIALTNLTWTASGDPGYVAGTMSTSDQTLGTFAASGNFSGTQTYQLTNSWTYATGDYSATITYTLTVP
jgi:hypothetical protein